MIYLRAATLSHARHSGTGGPVPRPPLLTSARSFSSFPVASPLWTLPQQAQQCRSESKPAAREGPASPVPPQRARLAFVHSPDRRRNRLNRLGYGWLDIFAPKPSNLAA